MESVSVSYYVRSRFLLNLSSQVLTLVKLDFCFSLFTFEVDLHYNLGIADTEVTVMFVDD
jgi:hypothetical protein